MGAPDALLPVRRVWLLTAAGGERRCLCISGFLQGALHAPPERQTHRDTSLSVACSLSVCVCVCFLLAPPCDPATIFSVSSVMQTDSEPLRLWRRITLPHYWPAQQPERSEEGEGGYRGEGGEKSQW